MSHQTASPADVDSAIPDEQGNLWLLREALDAEQLGISILELNPGASSMKHDHTEDGQEEVYCVIEGRVDVELDDETVTLEPDEAVRISYDQSRQMHNRTDDPAKLVLIGSS